MAGGQGTRFWPLSVEQQPKQFLRIAGEQSMLQETVSRLQPLLQISDVFIVSSAPYVPEIRDQLPDLADEQLIVEPAARNTAPCIGLAALHLEELHPGEAMVVLPSDHVIRDLDEFHQVLHASEELARDEWLITFGIEKPGAVSDSSFWSSTMDIVQSIPCGYLIVSLSQGFGYG